MSPLNDYEKRRQEFLIRFGKFAKEEWSKLSDKITYYECKSCRRNGVGLACPVCPSPGDNIQDFYEAKDIFKKRDAFEEEAREFGMKIELFPPKNKTDLTALPVGVDENGNIHFELDQDVEENDSDLDEKKCSKMRAALLKRLNKFVGKKYDEKLIKAIEQELIKFEFEMRFGT